MGNKGDTQDLLAAYVDFKELLINEELKRGEKPILEKAQMFLDRRGYGKDAVNRGGKGLVF